MLCNNNSNIILHIALIIIKIKIPKSEFDVRLIDGMKFKFDILAVNRFHSLLLFFVFTKITTILPKLIIENET